VQLTKGLTLFFLLLLNIVFAQTKTELMDTVYVYKSIEEAIKNPEGVFALKLKGNLVELPKEVLLFKNLMSLNLKGNRIHALPKEIINLRQLQEINLSKNKIEIIPAEIFDLKSLKKLVLSENLIKELPPEIARLQNLELLDLWSNYIENIPSEIETMPNLKLIDLQVVEFSKIEQAKIKEAFPGVEFKFSAPCACETH
jgi:Leucine rich repeat